MALTDTKSRVEVPINLLPGEIKTQQRTQRTFRIVLIGVGGLVLLLAILTVMVRVQISSAQNTLKTTQAQAAQLQTQVAGLQQFAILQASVDNQRTMLGTALLNDVSWSRFLDDLDSNMPNDATLASLNLAATVATTPDGRPSYGTATYSGTVSTFPGLANWLDTMAKLDGLHFVYLSNGTKSAGTGGPSSVSFSAAANLTPTMLSGRCQGANSQCP